MIWWKSEGLPLMFEEASLDKPKDARDDTSIIDERLVEFIRIIT
jgi:hypothetical protein